MIEPQLSSAEEEAVKEKVIDTFTSTALQVSTFKFVFTFIGGGFSYNFITNA